MKWNFTITDHDSRKKTDAATHTVQSHSELSQLQIFVREVLQNSLDSSLSSSTVQVNFRIRGVQGAEKNKFMRVLGVEDLVRHIEAVRNEEIAEKGVSILNDPKQLLDASLKLHVLHIEDYGTRGLVGPESENEKKGFEKPYCFIGLCRNIGDSQKGSGPHGGTYGFGKSVLWKHSRFSMIMFYSRLSGAYRDPTTGTAHDRRFFGQIRLAGHDLGGTAYSGEGFFGKRVESVTRSLYDDEADWFAEELGIRLRSVSEAGTTILIVDFDDPDTADQEESEKTTAAGLLQAAETYYWPAMVDGRLQVKITNETDEQEQSAQPDRSHSLTPFIRAYRAMQTNDRQEELAISTILTEVPKGPRPEDEAARARLSVCTNTNSTEASGNSYKNRTALIRGAGMVVGYERFQRQGIGGKDYCSVAVGGRSCPNPDPHGEKAQRRCEQLLALAEPVSHDAWTPNSDNLKGWRGAIQRIKEIRSGISAAISSATTTIKEPEGKAAPFLSAFFPLDSGDQVVAEPRKVHFQVVKKPTPIRQPGDSTVKFEFEVSVKAPSREMLAPMTHWKITCSHGLHGEARRRKIVHRVGTRFTHIRKGTGDWVALTQKFTDPAEYSVEAHDFETVIQFKGETQEIDARIAESTRHELEVNSYTNKSNEVTTA